MVCRLTRMYDGLEGEVARLVVKGELVDLHPAGADQHVVVLNSDQTVTADTQVGTWGSFVLFCPVVTHEDIRVHVLAYSAQT